MKQKYSPKHKSIRQRPGRSSELIRIRDINLIRRYYFWSEIKRRRLDDVLEILSKKEFFISEQTIWRIIKKNHGMIAQLRNGEELESVPDPEDKNKLTLFEH
jgi:hypothetical protein